MASSRVLQTLIVKIQGDVASLASASNASERHLQKIQSSSTGAGASLRRMFEVAAGNIASRAITNLTSLAKNVIVTGFNFNALKEQASVAFTTMLGDGQRAKQFLDELQEFAARTPFEFPDLIRGSQRLLAMGFSAGQVLPTLTAVGDAVAAMGGDAQLIDQVTRALGQMQAKGKASAEEMLQLTEAGIPAWENLAKKIGTSVPEAMKKVSQGVISSKVVIDAQIEGINASFGGMMEQQSKTFNGMLSTLKDTFTQATGTVLEPFFNIAKNLMSGLVADTGDPQMQTNLENISIKFLEVASAIYEAKDAAGELLGVLESLGGFNPVKIGTDLGDAATEALARAAEGLGFAEKGRFDAWKAEQAQRAKDVASGVGGNPFQQEIARILATQAGRNQPMFADPSTAMTASVDEASRQAAEAAANVDDFTASMGGAGSAALTLEKAISDGIISMAEAAELKLTPAAAGAAEAAARLASAELAAAERTFELGKAVAAVQAAADRGRESFKMFVRTMAEGALQLSQSAASSLFGRRTKEEAQAALRVAEIDRQIARLMARGADPDDRAIENLETQRERAQRQVTFLEADNRVQELKLELADKTLLTEAEQLNMTNELIKQIGELSGKVRDGVSAATNLVPGFDAARDAAYRLASALSSVKVPQYHQGTHYVPRTGLAMLEQGEQVVPRGGSGVGRGGGGVNVNIYNAGSLVTERQIVGQVVEAIRNGAGYRILAPAG